MNSSHTFAGYLARFPILAGGFYVILVIGLGLAALLVLLDISQRYGIRNEFLELLARLENRPRVSSFELASSQSLQGQSPFLEGQTATLASAALLHRIAGAITRVWRQHCFH